MEEQMEGGADGGGRRWKGEKMEEQMEGGTDGRRSGGGLHPSRCWSALQVYRAAGRHSCLVGEVGFMHCWGTFRM